MTFDWWSLTNTKPHVALVFRNACSDRLKTCPIPKTMMIVHGKTGRMDNELSQEKCKIWISIQALNCGTLPAEFLRTASMILLKLLCRGSDSVQATDDGVTCNKFEGNMNSLKKILAIFDPSFQ